VSFDFIPNLKDYRKSAVHIQVTEITEEDTHTIFLIDNRNLLSSVKLARPFVNIPFWQQKPSRAKLQAAGQTVLLGVDSEVKMSILYVL